MTYSFAPNDEPLYVSEGDYVQFRFKAPNQWDFTRTVTVTIGELVQYWLITTIPEDFTPDPFPFNNVLEADTDTLYTYADGTRPGESIITVSGLTPTTQAPVSVGSNLGGDINNYAMRIDYDGDGTWDTGWIQSGGSIVVENGAKIQVRLRSSTFAAQPARLTLVIGTSSEQWLVQTDTLPRNEPEPFPDFEDLTDQPANTLCYTTEIIRIQGLNTTAAITLTNGGEFAKSSTNATSVDDNGFAVLNNATWSSSGTVSNGDYIQLRITSSSGGNSTVSTGLTIGDTVNGDVWNVQTGNNPSTSPNVFSFPTVFDALEDTLVASAQRPADGISGLGTSVPVELVSTTSSEVKIKINDGSIGVFPATVNNDDKITLYARSSATYGAFVETVIRVGTRTISAWEVETNDGPDTDAIFTPPANKTNQIPSSFVSSAPVTITGINRPITIERTSGYDALISIDGDTPVTGPRTFDPAQNTSFSLVVQAADQLNTPESTTVSVGTGTANNPFTWTVRTYVTVPPPSTNLGVWYSKKTEKFDGYPIGTVLPILKEGVANYGDLDGGLGDRYPGFIECDGRSLNAAQYWGLFNVLENTYGGNGSYDEVSKTYSGSFNLPDYRNRRLCGVGIVDSSRGNSAALEISTSGSGINDPGAEGGYWYFDKIGARGQQPLEQVQGPTTSLGSLDSDYFSLGTVRLTGLETLVESLQFEISPIGYVEGRIRAMSDITVAPPQHNHAYISAVIESNAGDPLIRWGQPAGRSMMGTNASPGPEEVGARDEGGGTSETIRATWNAWLSGLRDFVTELTAYYGADFSMESFVNQFPTQYPYNQEGGELLGPPTDFGPESDDFVYTIDFLTWWISPASALNSAILQNRGITPDTGTNRWHAGVIDTQPSTFRIDGYLNTASGNETRTHRHLMTENSVGNPNQDFTGGNLDGSGSNSSPFGSGLGGGVDGSLLTFKLYWAQKYVNEDGTKAPGGGDSTSGGLYFPATTGDWSYRQAGSSFWSSATDEETRDEDMTGGSGSGMRLRITYQAWPTPSGTSANDTRLRIDRILAAGSGYQAGDQLSADWWDDQDGTANRIIEIAAVADAGSGGAADQIDVRFTQSDIFMDMTEAEVKFSSSFKRPVPDVEMRPQRQVPIINPFHKTKYVIKAY